MTKQLEIIINGKLEGKLEVEEIKKDEIKFIKLELPTEIKSKLHMGMFNEGAKYIFPIKEYIETIQHGMEHYLEKEVKIIEYQTSPSYSQKI